MQSCYRLIKRRGRGKRGQSGNQARKELYMCAVCVHVTYGLSMVRVHALVRLIFVHQD